MSESQGLYFQLIGQAHLKISFWILLPAAEEGQVTQDISKKNPLDTSYDLGGASFLAIPVSTPTFSPNETLPFQSGNYTLQNTSTVITTTWIYIAFSPGSTKVLLWLLWRAYVSFCSKLFFLPMSSFWSYSVFWFFFLFTPHPMHTLTSPKVEDEMQ